MHFYYSNYNLYDILNNFNKYYHMNNIFDYLLDKLIDIFKKYLFNNF